jgi:hypothetical protein
MVKLYRTANGFGWKLHNVVGAQIVSVPANLSDRAADAALQRTLWWLAAFIWSSVSSGESRFLHFRPSGHHALAVSRTRSSRASAMICFN